MPFGVLARLEPELWQQFGQVVERLGQEEAGEQQVQEGRLGQE
jgi:hypothetical protein